MVPAPTTAAMAVMVVARLHGTLAALAAQHAIWARLRAPGGALVRRLVLFADSTLDTVHTICSMPDSRCVGALSQMSGAAVLGFRCSHRDKPGCNVMAAQQTHLCQDSSP